MSKLQKKTHDVFLSVVIPAYNEEKRIKTTLADIKRYLLQKDFSYEVIVVSDGSTDNTVQVVKEFASSFPSIRVIENQTNNGKGYAVRCGMIEATGQYKLFMDADNSVRINTIEHFMEYMAKTHCDIAIGSIAFSNSTVIEHNGWHRRAFGSLSKFLVRILATPGIHDTQRGFKLFSQRAADAIFPLQKIRRFGFDIELIVIARLNGYMVRELSVAWNNPAGSKVSLMSYADSFIELLRICSYMLQGVYTPQSLETAQNLSIERV